MKNNLPKFGVAAFALGAVILVGCHQHFVVPQPIGPQYTSQQTTNQFTLGQQTLFSMAQTGAIFILHHPQSAFIKYSNSVTFDVVAMKVPPGPLFYQWRFNDTAITNATNSSYTIAPVGYEHIGKYTVFVSGSEGVESEAAFLSVYSLTTPNTGNMQSPLSMFIVTNTGAILCPTSFDRFYTYMFFNGKNVPESLWTPPYHNANFMNNLRIDTCSVSNASGNQTAVRLVKNTFSPLILACDDDGSTCSVGSQHSSANATLPTEGNGNARVRVVIYYKNSSIATGQTNLTFNWEYF